MAAGGRLRCGGRDSATVLPCLTEVWRGGGMRFNKAELACLAAHPSHQFDKEGVLLLRERHDGFFRRTEGLDGVKARKKIPLRELTCVAPQKTVSTERWCRLRGNLLFYFKSRDHWSEPAGVIVLENFQVTLDQCTEAPFAFNLVFEGGTQHCGALCQGERDAWITAIHQASFAYMRQQVESLQQEVAARQSSLPADIHHHRINTGITLEFAPRSECSQTGVPRPPVDVNEPPFLEMCISCDNLRCDGDGRPPNPRVSVQVLNPPQTAWLHYAQTEVIETTSNPNFLSTVSFRKSDGLDSQTQVRLVVYDVRERVTNTTTQLGQSMISLGGLHETGRSRLSLLSPAGRNVGFITISAWTLEAESVDASSHTPSNATPHHQPAPPPVACHRRTQSLPPRLSSKTRHPTQGHLSLLFDNPTMATFRFHSGLGGDIAVLEVMAESRYCFLFPQQLLRLWMSEERRWQEELSSLGDLSDQWHTRQMALLNQHVTLINIYNMALDTLDVAAHSGSSFKKSTDKGETSLEMSPTNLHLQRLWAQNESLRRSGFYDIITCGIFTAFSQGYKKGGLINMLQKAKSSRRTPGGGDKAWASEAAVEGIKRLRQEVVTLLRSLLVTLRQGEMETLTTLLTKLQEKTRSLLNVIEPSLVEEAFEFLDQIRVPQNPSRILTLATRTYSNYNISGYLSPETALDLELMSPDAPNLPVCGNPEHRQGEAERTISVMKDIDIMDIQENSIYRPTDEPEPWDLIQLNVQASIMCLSSKIKTFCNRMNESRERGMSESASGELQNELQSKDNCGKDTTLKDDAASSAGDQTDTARSQVNVTEAQNITPSLVAQTQAVISTSLGSDSSHASGKSMSSSLGVARTNESQRSSCSATPDVSPCEEDSGIGLERVTSEVERTDCISDGGLSVDDERRDELLPLDKTEVKRGEREEHAVNSDTRYGTDSGVIKSSKLESIMEQSIEDLGPSLDGDVKSIQTSSDDGIQCLESGTLNEKESMTTQRRDSSASKNVECNGDETNKNQNSTGYKDENKDKDPAEVTPSHKAKGKSTPEEVDWVSEVRPSMKKLRQAMDGLMRTARLVHSVFRLQQTPEAAQATHNIKYRRDICFSQALTSLVTGLMTRLWCRKADPLFVTVLAHLGPLAEFECLVSCHGNDEGMLSDMVVAVEDLGTVEFVMVSTAGPQNGNRTRSEGATPPQVSYELPMPHVSGNRCGMRVVLPVPEHVFSLLPNTSSQQPNDPPTFCVTPVLFNIGINEEATLAEKLGTDGPQTRNNQDSYERLSQYYHRFKKLPLPQESSRRVPSMGSEVPLVDLIDKLGVEVMSSRSKNPAVLYLAAQCCRAMAGLRFTSCKSGKDRTGMSATLEQASILAAEYDLAETEFQRALNCMRSEGTRLENCQKNVGSRRYAFSAINLTLFPKQYRPPSGTYGSSIT
ncbi:LOW QUALITY PROTEIN: inositol polyphosphate-4-phosphatase type I A-like [Portunus trituberculatus]|uniref:LOW QUALITY PROTEIN: inositol polyphosphate-4-phosphatase type I A-like n=1 Tax=Portunus trituberculatus TaxID=210409 RepID=UPI001E1CEFBE|nr:LOW QUALITY PROTEIN: inositol polyphosphate-4-phosphatase type I A-like [Portunus trituberculatus]